ncbi:uroporphyrinogen-III synthase [Streptosporangium roseum]|uniref:Uroporphyrinogen-III synthase-like protein n=1 Tax=Streptosporangium roseum (strain ATCC 12428 / DSM 43021 / JCM 3005 / KCTC 9067 / NCIMB 10171 / NRRL 2505 / NI 9100) TaxID=479432 RepID=D2AU02_STRRD|nr:uroporphyrinogen-III synthase [Streptosporangium roseum]ACZ88657.1 Uroporphyrinogen-III synthase-like protein [Streptosporangium roseum DSM 43021]
MSIALLDDPGGSPETAPDALAGFTIGVTATRRREEFCALLERRGARVVRAPAIRLVPLAEDADLLAATRAALTGPLDDVVVTTGVGFRGWMAAAEGWGLSGDLSAHLTAARLLTRGPKARGAVRAAGLNDHWTPATESCEEVKQYLLAQDLRGRRIAVQLHGEPLTGFVAALREAGAEVIEVPVYRWLPYRDTSPLRRLISQSISGGVDAVAFTSAPAVLAMLAAARADGLEDALVAAFAGPVVAACVGPVTAAPLQARGVPAVQPERARLGALARTLARHLPEHSVTRLLAGGHGLEIRGHAVAVDGELKPLPPAPMAVLKRLADKPGHVVARSELRTVLPGGPSRDSAEHAVEMAITRLRRALGPSGIVETVVKRGYRLACDRGEAM